MNCFSDENVTNYTNYTKYENSLINGPVVELINIEWPFPPKRPIHCLMVCNEVPDCTGIFMAHGNGGYIASCHLLNITVYNIQVNETKTTAPTDDPWLKFYNDGLYAMPTSVFIRSKYNYKHKIFRRTDNLPNMIFYSDILIYCAAQHHSQTRILF